MQSIQGPSGISDIRKAELIAEVQKLDLIMHSA